MIRDDLNLISDEDYDKLVETFNNAFLKHFKDNHILEKYIAYYIVERINCNFLFREKLDQLIFSALDDLSQFRTTDCDYNIIKQILKKDYKLKIINEDPLDILCIDQ